MALPLSIPVALLTGSSVTRKSIAHRQKNSGYHSLQFAIRNNFSEELKSYPDFGIYSLCPNSSLLNEKNFPSKVKYGVCVLPSQEFSLPIQDPTKYPTLLVKQNSQILCHFCVSRETNVGYLYYLIAQRTHIPPGSFSLFYNETELELNQNLPHVPESPDRKITIELKEHSTTIFILGEKIKMFNTETFNELLIRLPFISREGEKYLACESGGVNLSLTFAQFSKKCSDLCFWFQVCTHCRQNLTKNALCCPTCETFVHEECFKDHYDFDKCPKCKQGSVGCQKTMGCCEKCDEYFCGECCKNGIKYCCKKNKKDKKLQPKKAIHKNNKI